jgi:chromosome segregation ATPase
MDDILQAGAEAVEQIKHSKERLTVVVNKLESASTQQTEIQGAIAELNTLLEQNKEILNKLEASHSKLMEAVQAEWRDTRESIRDRIDNTFSQLSREIVETREKLRTQFSDDLANATEEIISEMPRGLFGRRGRRNKR